MALRTRNRNRNRSRNNNRKHNTDRAVRVGRLVVATASTTVTAGAALLFVTSPAQADSTWYEEGDLVKQYLCAETKESVAISFTNEYGNQITLSEDSDGGYLRGSVHPRSDVTCIYKEYYMRDSGVTVTSVEDSDGGYVSCTVLINGVKVADSFSDAEYYSSAFC